MYKIKIVTKAKILLLKNALQTIRRSTKLYLLFLWLFGLVYLCGSFARIMADSPKEWERPNTLVFWVVTIIIVAILGSIPSAIRKMFTAKENKLLCVLPITSSEFFWIKAIENIFWNTIILFPLGCSIILSYAIVFPRYFRSMVFTVIIWFFLTVVIGLSQSILAKAFWSVAKRLTLRGNKQARKKRSLWVFLESRIPFIRSLSGEIIFKDLFGYFRENQVSAKFLVLLTVGMSLLLALVARNLTVAGEWQALRNIQIFSCTLAMLIWSTIIFTFSEEEAEWLSRVLPLLSRTLYRAELWGLFLFLLLLLFLFILPSAAIVVIEGGNVMGIYGFVIIGAGFSSLWAMAIKYFVFPKLEFGRTLYTISIIVVLVAIRLYPPTIFLVFALSWRFAQIGIRKLETYQFE